MDTGVRFGPNRTRAELVWVTRTAPHNLLTARHLRSAGLDPLIEPALRIVALPSPGPIEVPDALVFTSLQGVRLHRFFPSLASLAVFTVGDHSARFARLRGYTNVTSAAGDVHDLRRLVAAALPAGSKVLHVSAARPAGDLVGMLREDGFMARRLCVYEAVEASPLDLEWIAGKLPAIGTILVHSPRAGRHVASWLAQQMTGWTGVVACISAAAARPFADLRSARTIIAAEPNEAALLDVLRELGVVRGSADRLLSPNFADEDNASAAW